jgi:hypothetical protein
MPIFRSAEPRPFVELWRLTSRVHLSIRKVFVDHVVSPHIEVAHKGTAKQISCPLVNFVVPKDDRTLALSSSNHQTVVISTAIATQRHKSAKPSSIVAKWIAVKCPPNSEDVSLAIGDLDTIAVPPE